MFGNMASLTSGDSANNVIKYMMMSQMIKGMGGSGIGDGMNPMMMMMFMNGGGFGNVFDGIFNTNTIDPCKKNSTFGKRADTGVIDEFADVKEDK